MSDDMDTSDYNTQALAGVNFTTDDPFGESGEDLWPPDYEEDEEEEDDIAYEGMDESSTAAVAVAAVQDEGVMAESGIGDASEAVEMSDMDGDTAVADIDSSTEECLNDKAQGPLIGALLENLAADMPILGLSFLTEHQSGDGAFKQPHYVCGLCSPEGYMLMKPTVDHIRGFKHIYKYVNTFYPTKLAAAEVDSIKTAENIKKLMPIAKEVMETEGWSLEQININKMTAKVVDENGHPPKIVKLEGKGFQDHLDAQDKSEPYLGLELIMEHRNGNCPSQSYFSCELCNVSSTMFNIIVHLISVKHRMKYIRTYYPDNDISVQAEMSKTERADVVRKEAERIIKAEGPKTFKLKIEKGDSFKPPVCFPNVDSTKATKRSTEVKETLKTKVAQCGQGLNNWSFPGTMGRGMPRGGFGGPGGPPGRGMRGRGFGAFAGRGGGPAERAGFAGRGMLGGRPYSRGHPPGPHSHANSWTKYRQDPDMYYSDRNNYDWHEFRPSPRRRITNLDVLNSLVNFKICGEEEASVALKASNVLAQALLQYRLHDNHMKDGFVDARAGNKLHRQIPSLLRGSPLRGCAPRMGQPGFKTRDFPSPRQKVYNSGYTSFENYRPY